MTHPDRIEDYLEHMLQAIERATRYVEPIRSSDELEQSPLIQDAVARNIEIIGEAANHITQMDPTLAESIAWRHSLGGVRVPRGVHRFKTHEDADEWLWRMITRPTS